MGKILLADLSHGVCREETLSDELCRDFMGGYGIGARILYERMKPCVDPLGPDNLLAFASRLRYSPFVMAPPTLRFCDCD